MMHQAAWRYCRPQASIRFDTYHADGRTIVVSTVPRAERRPVCAIDEEGRQRAYIRIADENIVASPVHLAIWRQEQAPVGQTFTYGDAERQLMAAMGAEGQWQSLAQLVRRSRLPRPRVVVLLARLCRYGLVHLRLSPDHSGFEFAI